MNYLGMMRKRLYHWEQEVLRGHNPPDTTVLIRVQLRGCPVHHVEDVLVWCVQYLRYGVLEVPSGGNRLLESWPDVHLEIRIDPKTGAILEAGAGAWPFWPCAPLQATE